MSKKNGKFNKSADDLYSEIYNSHSENSDEIDGILESIKVHITDTASAAVLGPMAGQLLNTKIKNTQLLIELTKMLTKENDEIPIEEKLNIPREELNELLSNIIKDTE